MSDHDQSCGWSKKGSSSFLRKRTKKLLFIKRSRCPNAYAKQARVFASFFKKKCFLAGDGSVSRQPGIKSAVARIDRRRGTRICVQRAPSSQSRLWVPSSAAGFAPAAGAIPYPAPGPAPGSEAGSEAAPMRRASLGVMPVSRRKQRLNTASLEKPQASATADMRSGVAHDVSIPRARKMRRART